ncbi:MAG: hypothetical protein U0840_16075 [Gemmataceae bacterium]
MSTPAAVDSDITRWQRLALIAGVAGVAITAVGMVYPDTDIRDHAFRAWLVAFCFSIGIALGSLVVLMLQYLTGGEWGYILRRPLEAAASTLPLMAVLYLPIAFGLPILYEWANPSAVEESVNLQHKALYLNTQFAWIRAAIYFVIWCGLTWMLVSRSRAQDTRKDPAIHRTCETISAPGLVLYVLTITFASIDWAMSLEPEWYSTIYGAMFGMGQVLSGFAFSIILLVLTSKSPEVERVLSGNNLRDLGSLMLAFVMVWAYLSFSQFLLIWSGNLPEEVPWYIYRLKDGWQYLGLLLVVFHFALPFALLLSTDVKRNRGRLATVAGLVLVMRVVDLLWLIVPAFHHHKEAVAIPILYRFIYLAAIVGLTGLFVAYTLFNLRKAPLVAAYKPDAEGAGHGAVAH